MNGFWVCNNFFTYRRRRQFATAATAPRIFGIFFTTILNIKPEKIIKYKWLVCK